MSGMIRNEDVAYVREHIRIDQVVGDYLHLNKQVEIRRKASAHFMMRRALHFM